MNAAKKAFQGVGWAFRPHVASGRVALSAYEDQIAQSIRIIIGTNPGERTMRPTFGAGLRAFVFEPVNPATMEALRRRVEDALIDWEPRIDVEGVAVTTQPSLPGRVDIDVAYRVRLTNAHRNLVYPFYLEEGQTT